jgi:hypothetical protein
MTASPAASDPVPAGDSRSHRPLLGKAPVAPSLISHRQQQGIAGSSLMAAPPKPKDSFAYLPLAIRPTVCGLNAEEEAIAILAHEDPEQEREEMRCHQILARVARERAEDMVARDYFDPVNPDGFGPNYLVEQAGYALPDWYLQGLDANNIESIAAGSILDTPEKAWDFWLDSPGHSDHVLGESDGFADQNNYGIGYAAGGRYEHYWVFISAPPPGSE